MNKIKITSLLPIFFLLLGGIVVLKGGIALAAEPGCYTRTSSGTVTTVRTATCETEAMARSTVAPYNKCYVKSAGQSGVGKFVETDCSTFTVTGASTDNGGLKGGGADGEGPVKFGGTAATGDEVGANQCGKGEDAVHVSFDFGCIGGDANRFTGEQLNPIVDIAFALFRFLSAGVGLVVIGSIVVAGVQYSMARGDPQATGASIKRISNSLIALLLYIFLFAIANFLVPGGMFI